MKASLLAIGDITVDAFVQLSDAWVETDNPESAPELCMRFGDKIPYQSLHEVAGVGNAPNASVCATRLGLHSHLIANLGNDDNGKKCLAALAAEGVDTENIAVHEHERTNYHFVLSFGAERTILVKHEIYRYTFPSPPHTDWVYLSSLGGKTLHYHEAIAAWLAKHPDIKLAFQPGSFQIAASGEGVMKKLYARAEVVVCNKEEAAHIMQNLSRGAPSGNLRARRREHEEFFSKKISVSREARPEEEFCTPLSSLHSLGPKIVCITDGPRGAYMNAPEGTFFMPPYPDPAPPKNRTGAGDAFAATFVSYLALGKTPQEALRRAPINSAFVVQHIGAQKGLLTKAQLEQYLTTAPEDFSPQKL